MATLGPMGPGFFIFFQITGGGGEGAQQEVPKNKRPFVPARTEEELKKVLLDNELKDNKKVELTKATKEILLSIVLPFTLSTKQALQELITTEEPISPAVEELKQLNKHQQIMLLLLLDELTQ